MSRKIIVWGVAASLIGLAGWFLFVILSILTLGKFRDAANFFGYVGLLGFPVSVFIWAIKKIFKFNRIFVFNFINIVFSNNKNCI